LHQTQQSGLNQLRGDIKSLCAPHVRCSRMLG